MLTLRYKKSFAPSLISIAALGVFAKCEIQPHVNEAALQFAYRWLENSIMHVGMIIPNKHPFTTGDLVKLVKKINADREGKTIFFMVNSNVTKQNSMPPAQNELIWFPFDIKNYDIDCIFIEPSRHNRLTKKHFFVLVKLPMII